MTSKEKLALIKETWYDVDLTDEKYINFDEEQTFNDLEKDLEVLDQLKEILSMDYLVRVYGYEMAKRLQTYLKSNEVVKNWLEKRDN